MPQVPVWHRLGVRGYDPPWRFVHEDDLLALSWRLHLQSSSPVGGLEYIKYPIIISTEKLKQTLGFRFAHTSRDALHSFLRAR